MSDGNSFDEYLHPAATKNSGKHLVRVHKDKKEEMEIKTNSRIRGPFQRDKNRILYSKSFRRLIHKTQVCYAGVMNEHIRTRLTHTLEVSQIARSISHKLSLNEDLAEAIALGHDLGHTPFGHRGEATLQEIFSGRDEEIKKEFFGQEMPKVDFKHNFQSVRVLTELEEGYPDFKGLNLTFPVLEGILKHTKIKSAEGILYDYENINEDYRYYLNQAFSCSIEGQVVALADEIAQVSHDIEDAIEYNYDTKDIIIEKINSIINNVPVAGLEDVNVVNPQNIKYVISCIIGEIITNAIENIRLTLTSGMYSYPLDTEIATQIVLRDFELYQSLVKIENTYIIHNFTVDRMNDKSKFIIRQIVRAYLNNPRQLPDYILEKYTNLCQLEKLNEVINNFKDPYKNIRYIDPKVFDQYKRQMIRDPAFLRLVCDHISSMTDIYAVEEFRKLYSHYVG